MNKDPAPPPPAGLPLCVSTILRRADVAAPVAHVLTESENGHRVTVAWRDLAARARRLDGALRAFGVEPGDRVATFAWNSGRHLELFFGVPMSGAAVVPVNARFSDEQIVWVLRHSQPRVLVTDASLTGRVAPLLAELDEPPEHIVVIDGDAPADPALRAALDYETLLTGAVAPTAPREEEQATACVFYTSGTGGRPKAVAHPHRSIFLHTLGVCAADAFAVRESDVVLPLTPLFHAAAWGLPYAAALTGANLIFLGPHLQPQSVVDTVERERVTIAAGVPTFWLAVAEIRPEPHRFASLERIICGGSAVPAGLVSQFARYGVVMQQGLGMTEMTALVGLSTVRGALAGLPDEERTALHTTQGLPVPGIEARVVDQDDDTVLPADGRAVGELQVRSIWGATAYLRPDDDSNTARFHDGWLRTGDVGTIDEFGYIRLLDRSKDVIKSGGEWISSVTLESLLMDHPGVARAAVIAIADPRWSERPLAVVVPRDGHTLTEEGLTKYLDSRVPRWWLPDRYVFTTEIPLTATSKFDKKALRATYGRGTDHV